MNVRDTMLFKGLSRAELSNNLSPKTKYLYTFHGNAETSGLTYPEPEPVFRSVIKLINSQLKSVPENIQNILMDSEEITQLSVSLSSRVNRLK